MDNTNQAFFAPCPRGLEEVLSTELQQLGTQALATQGGVGFSGTFSLCYRVNLESRIASRVLWRISHGNYRNEEDIYQAAYIDFSKGSYSLAIAGFREFLRRYPDHELAGSAQYWIGEAYLSLARGFTDSAQGEKASESLEQAVQEFKKVLANYPRAEKVPTALYKEALALIDLKQPGLAQARLQYLVDNFPRAEEISLARERLAALKTR